MVKRYQHTHETPYVRPDGSKAPAVDFRGVYESQVKIEGFFTIGEKKYVLKGMPYITRIRNSEKYGKQVQVQVMAPLGSAKLKDRVNYAVKSKNAKDRIEIFFPVELFWDMVRQMAQIRAEEARDKTE